jgi:hypothetical protein
MEARHRAAIGENMTMGINQSGFALPTMNTPGVDARPGSDDELAALGLDRRLRLATRASYQGEACFVKPQNIILYTCGIRRVYVRLRIQRRMVHGSELREAESQRLPTLLESAFL